MTETPETYVLAHCLDGPDSAAIRAATRPDHLAFIASLGDRVMLGGPIMDDAGARPVGSFIILKAGGVDEAEALLCQDPYRKAGLFERVELRLWQGVAGRWWPGDAG